MLNSKAIEAMHASLKTLLAQTETKELSSAQTMDLKHITGLVEEIRQKAEGLSANLSASAPITAGYNAASSEVTDFGAPPIVRFLSENGEDPQEIPIVEPLYHSDNEMATTKVPKQKEDSFMLSWSDSYGSSREPFAEQLEQ